MSGINVQGWLPSLGLLLYETWGSSDPQPRQAPALLGTGSLKASELKHWPPEQNQWLGSTWPGSAFLPIWLTSGSSPCTHGCRGYFEAGP